MTNKYEVLVGTLNVLDNLGDIIREGRRVLKRYHKGGGGSENVRRINLAQKRHMDCFVVVKKEIKKF